MLRVEHGIGIWWVSYVTDSPRHVKQTASNEFISSLSFVFFPRLPTLSSSILLVCIEGAHRNLHTICYRRRPHKPSDCKQWNHKESPVLRKKDSFYYFDLIRLCGRSHIIALVRHNDVFIWWTFIVYACLALIYPKTPNVTRWRWHLKFVRRHADMVRVDTVYCLDQLSQARHM